MHKSSNVYLSTHSNITDSPVNIPISERGKDEAASILGSETDYGANTQILAISRKYSEHGHFPGREGLESSTVNGAPLGTTLCHVGCTGT